MIHVRAGHAHGSRVLHDQPPAVLAAARRARPLLDRGDDSQVGRAALTFGQPRSPASRQLCRDPVRAIRPLDPLIARLREPARALRLARSPARHRNSRGRDLPQLAITPPPDTRPGALHGAARASPDRPARRSRSRTSVQRARPQPPAPPADRAFRQDHEPRPRTLHPRPNATRPRSWCSSLEPTAVAICDGANDARGCPRAAYRS